MATPDPALDEQGCRRKTPSFDNFVKFLFAFSQRHRISKPGKTLIAIDHVMWPGSTSYAMVAGDLGLLGSASSWSLLPSRWRGSDLPASPCIRKVLSTGQLASELISGRHDTSSKPFIPVESSSSCSSTRDVRSGCVELPGKDQGPNGC